MNEAMELLIKEGRAKLAEKRQKDLEVAVAEQEKRAISQAKLMGAFCDGLAELIGKAMVNELQRFTFEDICGGSPELRIDVDGFPVLFRVYHNPIGQNVRFGSDEPFLVAGIYHYEPSISVEEGELYPGCVDFAFSTVKSGQPTERFADLATALAMAAERAQIMRDLTAKYAQRTTELQLQLGNAKMKKMYELGVEKPEPVYVPEELLDVPALDVPALNGIINLDELVKLVRGIVEEYVQP